MIMSGEIKQKRGLGFVKRFIVVVFWDSHGIFYSVFLNMHLLEKNCPFFKSSSNYEFLGILDIGLTYGFLFLNNFMHMHVILRLSIVLYDFFSGYKYYFR